MSRRGLSTKVGQHVEPVDHPLQGRADGELRTRGWTVAMVGGCWRTGRTGDRARSGRAAGCGRSRRGSPVTRWWSSLFEPVVVVDADPGGVRDLFPPHPGTRRTPAKSAPRLLRGDPGPARGEEVADLRGPVHTSEPTVGPAGQGVPCEYLVPPVPGTNPVSHLGANLRWSGVQAHLTERLLRPGRHAWLPQHHHRPNTPPKVDHPVP